VYLGSKYTHPIFQKFYRFSNRKKGARGATPKSKFCAPVAIPKSKVCAQRVDHDAAGVAFVW